MHKQKHHIKHTDTGVCTCNVNITDNQKTEPLTEERLLKYLQTIHKPVFKYYKGIPIVMPTIVSSF